MRLKREPKLEEVFDLAVTLRIALIIEARSAEGVLGEAPPWMPALEANIRMHLHDILFPHHEKDANCLATFPTALLAILRSVRLAVRHGTAGRISGATVVYSEVLSSDFVSTWYLVQVLLQVGGLYIQYTVQGVEAALAEGLRARRPGQSRSDDRDAC